MEAQGPIVGMGTRARRVPKELRLIEEARAAGEPYACGLAVALNVGDPFDWLCTYTCPQHYVLRGEQRVSPYAGCVVRFRILFPERYPEQSFKLLIQPASDFFHPLVACAPDTGACVAAVICIPLLSGKWSPTESVRHLLKEGLLPMWTDGDCWVDAVEPHRRERQTFCSTCGAFSLDDCCVWDVSPLTEAAVFPDALPPFEGDMRPLIEQSVQDRAASSILAAETAAREQAEDTAALETEREFGIVIRSQTGKRTNIRVKPFFRYTRFLDAVGIATGDYFDPDLCRFTWNGKWLNPYSTLRDFGIVEGSNLDYFVSLKTCRPYSIQGFNPVAARLLLTDVEVFEYIARLSWSAQRDPLAPPPPGTRAHARGEFQ